MRWNVRLIALCCSIGCLQQLRKSSPGEKNHVVLASLQRCNLKYL